MRNDIKLNMRNKKVEIGFSLIELLIVIMLINILAAVAITVYIGVRDKARRETMVRSAKSAEPELQHWLQSSLSTNQNFREIDTNFSGNVDGNDSTNGQMFNNVATLFITGRNTTLSEISPWFDNTPLWNSNSPPIPGTISVTQPSPNQIRIVAVEKHGNIITDKTIAAE
jgi:prepilin-type N-terminal cleavage/methylation domain-containing protein